MGEVIVPHRGFPELKARREILIVHLARALNLDSLRSSHPVEVGCQVVNAVRAVRQIFDSWMLAVIVDEDKFFLDKMSICLKDKLFGKAITEDF